MPVGDNGKVIELSLVAWQGDSTVPCCLEGILHLQFNVLTECQHH